MGWVGSDSDLNGTNRRGAEVAEETRRKAVDGGVLEMLQEFGPARERAAAARAAAIAVTPVREAARLGRYPL